MTYKEWNELIDYVVDEVDEEQVINLLEGKNVYEQVNLLIQFSEGHIRKGHVNGFKKSYIYINK